MLSAKPAVGRPSVRLVRRERVTMSADAGTGVRLFTAFPHHVAWTRVESGKEARVPSGGLPRRCGTV